MDYDSQYMKEKEGNKMKDKTQLYEMHLLNAGMKDGEIETEVNKQIEIMKGLVDRETATYIVLKDKFPKEWEKLRQVEVKEEMVEKTYVVKRVYTTNQDGSLLKTKKGSSYFRLILEGIEKPVSFFEGVPPKGLVEGMSITADVSQSGDWWNGKNCSIVANAPIQNVAPVVEETVERPFYPDMNLKDLKTAHEFETNGAIRGHIENVYLMKQLIAAVKKK